MTYYLLGSNRTGRESELLTHLQHCGPDGLVHDGGGGDSCPLPGKTQNLQRPVVPVSRGIGRTTTTDYLTEVRDLDFTETMELILRGGLVFSPYSHAPLRHGLRRKHLFSQGETTTTAARALICAPRHRPGVQ